jgi:uncharacterized protein (TIGR03437 family)
MSRKTFAITWMVLCSAAMVLAQTPVIGTGGILNGASFRFSGAPGGGIAPGAIISIFGANLATATGAASNVPLPNSIGGTSVTIGGKTAPLFFVSSGQVNAEVPWGTANGSQPVVVTLNGTSSAAATVTVQSASPGIFSQTSNGKGPGAIQNFVSQTSTPLNNAGASIAPGGLVIIYATGLGAVNNTPADGAAGGGQTTTNAVTVKVGTQTVTPDFAGLAPGFVGLNQVNVRLPASQVQGCNVPVQLLVAGQASNTATLAVSNAANCTTLAGEFAPGPNSTYGALGLVRGSLTISGSQQFYSSLSTGFLKYGPAATAPLIAPPTGGGCLVDFFQNNTGISTFPDFTGGVTAKLDAGQLTYTPFGTGSSIIVNGGGTGSYATQSPVSITPGVAGFKFGGGRDVGTFSTSYTVPGGFPVTTSLNPITNTFSQGLGFTVNWNACPDPNGTVIVGAFSLDPKNVFQGTAYCTVACSAGTFKVGSDLLSQLPLNNIGGAGIFAAFVGAPVKFTSTGLDAGFVTFLDFTSIEGLSMLP